MSDLEKNLTSALSHLHSGEIRTAICEFKEIVKNFPECDRAYYFMSLGLYAAGELEEAAINAEKALELNPDKAYIKDSSDMFYDLALECLEKNHFKRALLYFEKSLLLTPDDIDVIKNIGVCHYKLGEYESAAGYFLKYVQLTPQDPEGYTKLGNVYEIQGSLNHALNAYSRSVEIEPNNPGTFYQIGILYSKKQEYKLSIEYFKKTLTLEPNNAEAHFNLGLALYKDLREEESVSYYQAAISLKPDFPEAYLNLGLSLYNLDRFKEAIDAYKTALGQRPDYIEAHINLGLSYFNLKQDDDAEVCLKKAVSLDPNNLEALISMGFYYQSKNDTKKAASLYKKALTLNPNHPQVNYNLGDIHLLNGNFKDGWKAYEWRFKINSKTSPTVPKLNKPRWRGEPLEGKTLYVYSEQGFGDAIQFCRFFPQLAEMGAKIIYKAKPPLLDLFKESNLCAEIVDESIPDDSIEFDYYIPHLSLMEVLETDTSNIPLYNGYLKADLKLTESYREKYFNNDLYKIGIFWQGNTRGPQNRSMPLRSLLPLTDIDGVKVYSFQKGFGTEQLNSLPDTTNIEDMGNLFRNFSDTAAALVNLDLMVTIDTSIVHLAGALSKDTLLLLPSSPEWRWLQDINHTPWYKSVKVLRQQEPGNWASVVDHVCQQVKELKSK